MGLLKNRAVPHRLQYGIYGSKVIRPYLRMNAVCECPIRNPSTQPCRVEPPAQRRVEPDRILEEREMPA